MKNYYTKSMNLFKNLSERPKFSFISSFVNRYDKQNSKFFCAEQKNFYLDIINEGWNNIRNLGISLTHTRFSTFNFSADQYNEIISCLYITYRNKIYRYDQTKGKPSIFFYNYFLATIKKYLTSTLNSPSNYYRKNLKIIDSATSYLQSLNIIPNIEELSKITHLSHKTIKHALEQRIYHQPTTIDKTYCINSYCKNPEIIFINKERFQEFYNHLQESFSYKKQFESNFSSKELPAIYEEIAYYAKELGIY